jgi:hypothetical protein
MLYWCCTPESTKLAHSQLPHPTNCNQPPTIRDHQPQPPPQPPPPQGTVGAGLPVLSTLKHLLETGDRVLKIEGIFSGTLSYIFNTFGDGRCVFGVWSVLRVFVCVQVECACLSAGSSFERGDGLY